MVIRCLCLIPKEHINKTCQTSNGSIKFYVTSSADIKSRKYIIIIVGSYPIVPPRLSDKTFSTEQQSMVKKYSERTGLGIGIGAHVTSRLIGRLGGAFLLLSIFATPQAFPTTFSHVAPTLPATKRRSNAPRPPPART